MYMYVVKFSLNFRVESKYDKHEQQTFFIFIFKVPMFLFTNSRTKIPLICYHQDCSTKYLPPFETKN